MRGRNRWSMAVLGLGLGLGLGWTASPALGDDPSSLETEQVRSSPGSTWGHHHWRLGSGVCPKCAKISQNSGGAIPPAPAVMPPIVSASSPCADCGPTRTAPAPAAPTTPVLAGDAVPPPISPAANRTMPPGFAVVGEPSPSAEPEPIGVMQTNYRQGPSTAASTVYPPGRATTWNGSNPPGNATAGVDPTMGLIPAPTPQGGGKHSFLHILVFGRGESRRSERLRKAHAAISYGDGSQTTTELPAKMVYGR